MTSMTGGIRTQAGVVLDVAIVGAGIAGLSAAIGLRHAGHQVEILERSSFANEVGAAIHVCPNAARILERWGFDWKRARALVVAQGRVLDSTTMVDSYHARYDDLASRYGSPWYFIHRVDLHTELRRLAQKLEVKIRLGSEVKHVDAGTGVLTLASGQIIRKDLIVAADGVHSCLSPLVNGANTNAFETGQSAFRFMIPIQKLRGTGLAESLHIDEDVGMNIATHADRRLVWYPCRNGELLNLVAIHPDRKNTDSVESWNVDGRLHDLLDEYKDFHPDLVKLCSMAEDLKLWKLFYRPPIESWYQGKMVLSGDAAHPMLPHQGQGGGQAIEDAEALSVLFSCIKSKDEIPQRFQIYQDVRQNRAASMQILSNAGQDEAEKVRAEAQKYIKGPVPTNQAEFHAYNFGYDVMIEAEKALTRQTNCKVSL